MEILLTRTTFYIVIACCGVFGLILLLVIIFYCGYCQKLCPKKSKQSAVSKKERLDANTLTFDYTTSIEEQQTFLQNDEKIIIPSTPDSGEPDNPNRSTCTFIQPTTSSYVHNNEPTKFKYKELTPSDGGSSSSQASDCGEISASLFYDHTVEKLRVTVVQWSNSNIANSKARLSPYVKLCLLPNKERKYFTKTRSGENPIFDEEFSFATPYADLRHKTLHFSVCDFDRFSRQNILGNGVVELEELVEKLNEEGGTGEIWIKLSEHNELMPANNKGEILYSMAYFSTAGRITMTIIKAKDLNLEDDDTGVDVRVNLLLDGKVEKSIRTSLLRSNISTPIFNEQHIFDTPTNLLEQTSFEVLVYAYRSKKRRIIGKVMAGPHFYSTGTGVAHWIEMLQQPRTSISHWHKLM